MSRKKAWKKYLNYKGDDEEELERLFMEYCRERDRVRGQWEKNPNLVKLD